jgi:hypothetical protein
MKKSINNGINKKECSDTGMAMALISLLAGLFTKHPVFDVVALITIVITMGVPIIFYPLAIIWFGLSKAMGKVSSMLLLGLVFFLVVTPVGLFRRVLGRDRLNLLAFKRDNKSIFTERSHLYEASDFTHTF